MRRIFCIALFLLVICTGCASENWTKKDYSQEQFYSDSFACEKEADSLVSGAWIWIIPYAGVFMGITNAAKRDGYYDRCLQSKGYVKQK
jgi:hypothetical protein